MASPPPPPSSPDHPPALPLSSRPAAGRRISASASPCSSTETGAAAPATTVRHLAIIALSAARKSALRARLRALNLSHGAQGQTPSPVGRLAARCAVLYRDCHQAAAHALARVNRMPAYDVRVAHAVTDMRAFLEKCQRLFDAREIASPLEQVNRDMEAKLGIASEIVRLLR